MLPSGLSKATRLERREAAAQLGLEIGVASQGVATPAPAEVVESHSDSLVIQRTLRSGQVDRPSGPCGNHWRR